MNALRILTVDDEPLALRRLKLLLQAMPGVDHVGEAGSCREALAKISSLTPDVVLLDIRMRAGTA
ncbi:MAG TPA: response regulator, partial [Sphingomicrobium sp.]